MEENRITAIAKEKTDVLTEAYKDTLEILDAYDHQTLTRPEGTYYDGDESIEEVAVNMLYDMIKNPVWYDCDKQMAAIKFLLFLEFHDAVCCEISIHDTETACFFHRNFHNCDCCICFVCDVGIKHLIVVHFVNVIAGKD